MRIDSGCLPFDFSGPTGQYREFPQPSTKPVPIAFLTPSYRLLPAMAGGSVSFSMIWRCAFEGLKLGPECGIVTPKPAAPAWLRFDEHASLDKKLGTASHITLVIQESF